MPLPPFAHALRRVLVDDIGLRQGDAILIALSAGPDSMALLHLLASLRSLLQAELSAAYVDHGLRPQESPQEWALAQEVCRELQIKSYRIEVNARGEAARQKLSLEHAARNLRYQGLERLQQELAVNWLALAHTADDQAEEVLLRLMRGGSRKALAGMRLIEGSRIRPLLQVPKKELLHYLEERNYPYCHDSSNDDQSFLRNRIRHHLLPLLEREYDPGIRQALLKSADNFAADEALLEELQEQAWQECVRVENLDDADSGGQIWNLSLPGFGALALALRRRVLERLLYTAQGAAEYEQIMALVQLAANAHPGKELHLRRGLRAVVERERIVLSFPWGKGATRRSCKR